MSADNWRACPVCFSREAEAFEAKSKAIDDSYGKIPVEDFDAQREALGDPPSMNYWEETAGLCTLREDFDIGISAVDGVPEFSVKYAGTCKVCSLSFTFEKTKIVSIPAKEKDA